MVESNESFGHVPRHARLLLLAALLVGGLLRWFRLGNSSLWYDETVSVYLAQLPLRAMVEHTARDIHPPGYYALLHLWQIVAQPAPQQGLEIFYAWVSAAFGVLVLALLFVVGRRLLGTSSALLGVWIAALNPFQVWYAQEVRMYTLGAALALLCLWAMLVWFGGGRTGARTQGAHWRWLLVYALSAAAGLYVLYYFAFVLAGLGVVSLLVARSTRRWLGWLAANGCALLLFAPWLPIFWRQATEPPVPPWRVEWSDAAAFVAALAEALRALVVGQSPVGEDWLWAAVALLIVVLFVAFARAQARSKWTLLAFVFVPVLLLFALSALVTPLYHVRYLVLFAGPVALLAGAAIAAVWRRARWLAIALAVLIVAGSGLGLWRYWTDPTLAKDDHRATVQTLMREWRPGDVVLVNAGWNYTPLEVYWQSAAAGDGFAPALDTRRRLLPDEVMKTDAPAEYYDVLVPVVRSGSVDGAAQLGWGNPAADFFAVSAQDTVAALEALAQNHDRIWHYRMYDTVSDPNGVIRAWLGANTVVLRDEAIPGRDFGRLELRLFRHTPGIVTQTHQLAIFGDALAIEGVSFAYARTNDAGVPVAGSTVYATVRAHWLAGLAQEEGGLSSSLRLYDAAGVLVAQEDSAPHPATNEWGVQERHEIALAVAIPANAAPGDYTLQLIIYRQQNGEALPVTSVLEVIDGQRLIVAPLVVAPEE